MLFLFWSLAIERSKGGDGKIRWISRLPDTVSGMVVDMGYLVWVV